MTEAETVVVAATHLRPATGFGGVAESTAEMIINWGRSGRAVAAVCSDGSRGKPLTQGDFECTLGCKVALYRSRVFKKWGFGLSAPWAMLKAFRGRRTIYVSGIGTWTTTLAAWIAIMQRKDLVIAPRGGILREHWAEIEQNKPLKSLFYKVFTIPSLRRARLIHVTSLDESQDIKTIIPEARDIINLPNIMSLEGLDGRSPSPPAVHRGLKIVYLGRLAREKGILPFATAFRSLMGPGDSLTIAGPVFDESGAEAVKLCEQDNRLIYKGTLGRGEVLRVLQDAHVLVLPSGVGGDIRENFGNVALEALTAGRMVMATRGLAWDQVDGLRLGSTFSRDLADLASALEKIRLLAADDGVWERCADYARTEFDPVALSEKLARAVYGE